MSSSCAIGISGGMAAMVARSNVALTRVSDITLPLKVDSPVGVGGCCSRIGQRRRHEFSLLHKGGPLLATAQDSGEVDIVRITRNKDGSQLFSFGPVEDNGQAKQPPPTTAQAEPPPPASGTRSSGINKRSSVTKGPARTSVPSTDPQEESSPETSRPKRSQSGYAKRSPIPHSSSRTPVSRATNTPVAVSPTVTPARGGVSRPSTNAPLSGVRERTEAPIPTQDRLRPKSRFMRRSPVGSRPRKSRPAAPDSADAQPPTTVGSGRPRSAFSKPSPVIGKNARTLETVADRTEQQGAMSEARPGRPSSSFKKPSLALGRSPRGTPGARMPGKAEVEGDSRLKRPGTAFKKVSPISAAVRAVRKPGLRVVQDLTGIATNGVAKAAQKVEDVIGDIVASVSGGSETGWAGTDSEEESDDEGPVCESDLCKMKLKELRQLAKERKIKGMWTMKKAELIAALEVSFSEDV